MSSASRIVFNSAGVIYAEPGIEKMRLDTPFFGMEATPIVDGRIEGREGGLEDESTGSSEGANPSDLYGRIFVQGPVGAIPWAV